MRSGTTPERLTRLETQMDTALKVLDKISTKQDAIDAKVSHAEGQVSGVRGVVGFAKAAAPTVIAVAAAFGLHMGLPR